MTRARFAVGFVLCGSLLPAAAQARPLDLSDPTPRTIQVEFEISSDPATVGQTWSAPFEATYSASGNTGTVVISASEYESAIATHDLDYFDSLMTWSLIPGSSSEFRLEIDLTTLEATAQTLEYEMDISSPVQQIGDVTRELSTTATAGFAFLPQYPGFPFFCAACPPVPGAPYDPNTGKINAVGSDRLDAPDVDLSSFSRAGDLRLSEQPAAVPVLSGAGSLGLAALLASLGIHAAARRADGGAEP